MLYFWKNSWLKDIRNYVPNCKFNNMQIQKNKYKNTLLHKYWVWWSACKTPHMLYYWQALDIRVSKSMFSSDHCTNTAIQKHKYTNTQINQRTGYKTLLMFLAALAALYLTLVVTDRHFRILTQIVTSDTSDPSDIWTAWCLDKKTKRQRDNMTKRQNTKTKKRV